jgi:hypothetical protein
MHNVDADHELEKKRRDRCPSMDETYEKLRAGYGSCSRCHCQAYEGNDVVCRNCGHAYDDHY